MSGNTTTKRDVTELYQEAQKPKEDEDRVNKFIVAPLALCVAYTWGLGLVARDAGGMPTVFSDVSWLPPAIATLVYFAFIYFGNKFMAKREPLALKNYMVTYNLYQTILNLYMFASFNYEIFSQGKPIWGNAPDWSQKGFKLSFLVWMHYNNKYVELLDTVFMVLRKKTNQISFLHVYHHVLLVWSWFAVCKIACGGDAYFGAMVNSFIHVVMYSYYLISLLGYRCFFKNYITLAQMLQFVVCAVHAIYCWVNQHITSFLPMLQLFVMVNMLILFGDFYKKAYKPKGGDASTTGADAGKIKAPRSKKAE